MKGEISELREALVDLTGVLNRPEPDVALIALAGVDLERALLPVLVRIERRGPLGIGELADLCGRDYTTLSRQVARLAELGLVARQVSTGDARIKQAIVTAKGRALARKLDGARQKLVAALLADWASADIALLARLLRRLADDALAFRQGRTSRPKQPQH